MSVISALWFSFLLNLYHKDNCTRATLKRISYLIYYTISVMEVAVRKNCLCLVRRVRDGCFRHLCPVSVFQSVGHYLSLKRSVVGFTFFLWFFLESSMLPTFLCAQNIFLVTLILNDISANNFSFTFIICLSIICQNMIHFWSKCEDKSDMPTIWYSAWNISITK